MARKIIGRARSRYSAKGSSSRSREEILLPAPREIASVAVRERVVPPEGSVIALRAVVAAGAADALGSTDRLLRGVQ